MIKNKENKNNIDNGIGNQNNNNDDDDDKTNNSRK